MSSTAQRALRNSLAGGGSEGHQGRASSGAAERWPWSPSVDRSHGEPFPLPLRPCADRSGQWLQRQVARSVRAVNRLAAARTNSTEAEGFRMPPHRAETAVQSAMLDSIERRVDGDGLPPPVTSPTSSRWTRSLACATFMRRSRRTLGSTRSRRLPSSTGLVPLGPWPVRCRPRPQLA